MKLNLKHQNPVCKVCSQKVLPLRQFTLIIFQNGELKRLILTQKEIYSGSFFTKHSNSTGVEESQGDLEGVVC